MDYNTCLGLAILIIIIIIIIIIVYKQFVIIEETPTNIFEKFTVTTIPTTTFNPVLKVKDKIDSRYNEILQSQYANIQKQQQLDELTDRLNTLNSELQKHTNSYMKYQTTGELNFY
jgi:hypothetical protein